MGCCNKRMDGEPVSPLRYWGGTALIAGVHLGLLAALRLAALVEPRCRRVLPFYEQYTRDTLGGVLRRERIRVGRACPDDACAGPPA